MESKITFRDARINRRLTILEVSQQMGVSPRTLVRYEKNSKQMPFDFAMELCAFYSISIDHIKLEGGSKTASPHITHK